jgi:hypothetical protein
MKRPLRGSYNDFAKKPLDAPLDGLHVRSQTTITLHVEFLRFKLQSEKFPFPEFYGYMKMAESPFIRWLQARPLTHANYYENRERLYIEFATVFHISCA